VGAGCTRRLPWPPVLPVMFSIDYPTSPPPRPSNVIVRPAPGCGSVHAFVSVSSRTQADRPTPRSSSCPTSASTTSAKPLDKRLSACEIDSDFTAPRAWSKTWPEVRRPLASVREILREPDRAGTVSITKSVECGGVVGVLLPVLAGSGGQDARRGYLRQLRQETGALRDILDAGFLVGPGAAEAGPPSGRGRGPRRVRACPAGNPWSPGRCP